MKNTQETIFATGAGLNEKLETIKFEKQVEELEDFKIELSKQISEIEELLMEKCPNEMNS